jgi:translation elongation factor EF-Tu-like GTPase
MREPKFIAHVTMLTKEEGGRMSPVNSKYRPHLVFDNDENEYMTSAQHIFLEDPNWLKPGESGRAELWLLSGDYDFKVGETFKTFEGSRQVGYGKVLEIL